MKKMKKINAKTVNQDITMYPCNKFSSFGELWISEQYLNKRNKNTPTLNFGEFRDDIIRFWGKIYPNEKHF